MSLILCRNEPVKQPLYIEKLGVHIYSSQELCYVIYQYPLLALNGFVDENLVEFIAVQLDMGFLAVKMEKWMKGGGGEEDPVSYTHLCHSEKRILCGKLKRSQCEGISLLIQRPCESPCERVRRPAQSYRLRGGYHVHARRCVHRGAF